ncbi:Yip1 domain-containing protein [Fontibacillus panacisegetis]|uniref:Yip1 domain-containing protein n=1 Tax=Fontibacillus panacisegetis TaxID=670482 RepID=A0A1G7QM64_9BACL|nr:YIP1 family protein [Fontibacillus panacisegetis]SDF99603.1 Yip1 domain-containing protein [Fontibacillus panacisegetis]
MKNLFTIFVSPESTFKRLKSSKLAWLIGMIVLIVLSLLVIYLQMPLLEQMMLDGLKSNAQISPDTYDSLMSANKIGMYLSGPITSIIMIFIIGLLLLLLNLIVRGEGKYMQFVTIAVFAALPGTVGDILTGILMNVADAQALTDVTISLGTLIQDKGSLLYKVLSLTNPFSIWTLVLYIIGSSVMMNRPKKKVGIWIVIFWCIFSFGALIIL